MRCWKDWHRCYANKSIRAYFLLLIVAVIMVGVIIYEFRGYLSGIEPIITFLTLALPYLLSQVNQIKEEIYSIAFH